MLQREMDSTVDYGIPSIQPKKGFLDKLFKREVESKLLDKVPVITCKLSGENSIDSESLAENINKTPKWRGLRPLSRLGLPIQIMSVIVIGTLLGAAYAVTMKSGGQLQPKKELALLVDTTEERPLQPPKKELALIVETMQSEYPKVVAEEQYFPEVVKDAISPVLTQSDVPKIAETEGLQQQAGSQHDLFDDLSLLQEVTGVISSAEAVVVAPKESEIKNTPELDVLLSLNISVGELSKTTDLPSDLAPKAEGIEQPQDVGVDSSLSAYEQQKIDLLQQQILSIKQKSKKYDEDNLSLKAKLASFTTKNKRLSEQFRHLEKLSDLLIQQLNFAN